jgi:hypothetical protein
MRDDNANKPVSTWGRKEYKHFYLSKGNEKYIDPNYKTLNLFKFLEIDHLVTDILKSTDSTDAEKIENITEIVKAAFRGFVLAYSNNNFKESFQIVNGKNIDFNADPGAYITNIYPALIKELTPEDKQAKIAELKAEFKARLEDGTLTEQQVETIPKELIKLGFQIQDFDRSFLLAIKNCKNSSLEALLLKDVFTAKKQTDGAPPKKPIDGKYPIEYALKIFRDRLKLDQNDKSEEVLKISTLARNSISSDPTGSDITVLKNVYNKICEDVISNANEDNLKDIKNATFFLVEHFDNEYFIEVSLKLFNSNLSNKDKASCLIDLLDAQISIPTKYELLTQLLQKTTLEDLAIAEPIITPIITHMEMDGIDSYSTILLNTPLEQLKTTQDPFLSTLNNANSDNAKDLYNHLFKALDLEYTVSCRKGGDDTTPNKNVGKILQRVNYIKNQLPNTTLILAEEMHEKFNSFISDIDWNGNEDDKLKLEIISQFRELGVELTEKNQELLNNKFTELLAKTELPTKTGIFTRIFSLTKIAGENKFNTHMDLLETLSSVGVTLSEEAINKAEKAVEGKEGKNISKSKGRAPFKTKMEKIKQTIANNREKAEEAKRAEAQKEKEDADAKKAEEAKRVKELKEKEEKGTTAGIRQNISYQKVTQKQTDLYDKTDLYKTVSSDQKTNDKSAIRVDQENPSHQGKITSERITNQIVKNVQSAKAELIKNIRIKTEGLNNFVIKVIEFAQANDGVGNAGQAKWEDFCTTESLSGDLYSFENAQVFSYHYQQKAKESGGKSGTRLKSIPEEIKDTISQSLQDQEQPSHQGKITSERITNQIVTNVQSAKAELIQKFQNDPAELNNFVLKVIETKPEELNKFVLKVIEFAQANDGVGNAGKDKWDGFCTTESLSGDLYSFGNAQVFSYHYQQKAQASGIYTGREENLKQTGGKIGARLKRIPAEMNEQILESLEGEKSQIR